ncbi:unnamed protein product [Allacma fusca]|uniref:Spindle assembly checkpoint component MAD1 n=1 Tax=Allacma fusca TaxID=39272 RepID=A0A8J2LHW2_9HEXA|nr:unnamed protein product [Allacma fusca]
MSRDAATPISKYLASIDRRHSLIGGSLPSIPATPVDTTGLGIAFNFNDTFLSDEQSLLHIPSPTKSNRSVLSESGLPSDRKRRKTFYEDDSEKLQRKSDELERILRQTQMDLIDSRSVITSLEHHKISSEATHKEQLISLQASNIDIRNHWKNALEKIKVLEEKVGKLEKKEKDTSDSLHEQKNAHSNMVCSLQNRILKLQSDNCELKQKYDEDINRNAETVRKLSNDLDGTERGAEKWIIESQSLKDQLTLVQSQLVKCQAQLKESQTKIIEFDELKSKYTEALSDATNIKITADQVKKWENLYVCEQIRNRNLTMEIQKLKQENQTLNSTMSSEMLLKEQIASLEMRVSHMTGELKEKVLCDENRKALQAEITEWKNVASKLDHRCKTPVNFESVLRQYQNQLLEFKHDNSDLKLQIQNRTELISKVQAENTSLREQVRLLKDLSEKQADDLKKTSKRLVLIAKDRDSLKGLKESYEQEFEGHCSKALMERNQQLEILIAQHETLISEDPSFTKRPCEKCSDLSQKIQELSAELKNAKSELDQKAASLILSQNELSKLESVDSDLSYKIISFGKNPSMMSIDQKLKEVLAENERLKTKLQQLTEDSKMDGMDATVVEEKKGLEEKLKTLERKHEILTDTYDYETSQLQTAIERLFGFHIILVREPQSQIRLQSVNSPNPDDMFIFQASENDWMLLETPVLDIFRQEIETYLLTAGNIPAFLGVVTVKYCQGIPESNPSGRTSGASSPQVQDQYDDEDEDDGDRRHTDEEDDEEDREEEEEGSENERSDADYSYDDDDASDDDKRDPPGKNANPPPGSYDNDDDDDEIIMLD